MCQFKGRNAGYMHELEYDGKIPHVVNLDISSEITRTNIVINNQKLKTMPRSGCFQRTFYFHSEHNEEFHYITKS
ncbi:hypothetical protein ANSO36C_52400 [Nostoc cf. commune SO-36]|uniref:Uncharacterized protein n=1 Tax=Nostoc cf. commune SO-36 TaxID=449208 RepID=A0ABM7Z8A8_NOSCO|nr:hypothetical protein ANSO36C_52400 [Nostoc cf. commune SO-36]